MPRWLTVSVVDLVYSHHHHPHLSPPHRQPNSWSPEAVMRWLAVSVVDLVYSHHHHSSLSLTSSSVKELEHRGCEGGGFEWNTVSMVGEGAA